jgi:hypothetical protein
MNPSFGHSVFLALKQYSHVYLVSILSIFIFLTGCAPAPVFLKSDYSKKNSLGSIAVMPTRDDRRKDKDLTPIEEIGDKLVDGMLDRYYDVLTPEKVVRILKEKGYTEYSVDTLSPQQICRTLSVEGILNSSLHTYDNIFFIHHKLIMDLQLFSANADTIWMHYIDESSIPILPAIFIGIIPMLVIEAIEDFDEHQISRYLETLPEGHGSGHLLRR